MNEPLHQDPLLQEPGGWGTAHRDRCRVPRSSAPHRQRRLAQASHPAWSPDGEQVLLLEEVGAFAFAIHGIEVDSLREVTIEDVCRGPAAPSHSW